MQRGDRVRVQAYPNVVLERRVLEVGQSYVLVCREEVYREVEGETGLPDQAMGFPIEDVSLVDIATVPRA